MLYYRAAFERAGKRRLIGEFQIAADRNPARDTSDTTDKRVQPNFTIGVLEFDDGAVVDSRIEIVDP